MQPKVSRRISMAIFRHFTKLLRTQTRWVYIGKTVWKTGEKVARSSIDNLADIMRSHDQKIPRGQTQKSADHSCNCGNKVLYALCGEIIRPSVLCTWPQLNQRRGQQRCKLDYRSHPSRAGFRTILHLFSTIGILTARSYPGTCGH